MEQDNQESILRGDQLNQINRTIDLFRGGRANFPDVIRDAAIGYAYIQTLEGLTEEMIRLHGEDIESNQKKEKPDKIFELEDINPKSWIKDDPELNLRMDQFTGLLARSISNLQNRP